MMNQYWIIRKLCSGFGGAKEWKLRGSTSLGIILERSCALGKDKKETYGLVLEF